MSAQSNAALGLTPTCIDVLFGKGTLTNVHEGNQEFRRLIKENHERYDNAATGTKYIVARDIVDFLYSLGCRFLQKTDDGIWQEVPKSRAYKKAQQSLRDGAPIRQKERLNRQLQEQQKRQELLAWVDFPLDDLEDDAFNFDFDLLW